MEGTEGTSAKKPLEKLVINNKGIMNDLKTKLHAIIEAGPKYEFDVSSCLRDLIKSSDPSIVLLTIQAISELAKSDEQRELLATKDLMLPMLTMLSRDVTLKRLEIIKQCCRALGNLCYNHDGARKIILENNGVKILHNVLECCMVDLNEWNDIVLLTMKTFLNYSIGGQEFSETLMKEGLLETSRKILDILYDKDNTESLMTSTVLMLLTVINDNDLEIVFDPEINISVLKILKITQNIKISEMCLEHLETQAIHDSVKILFAKEGGVNAVCVRTEELIEKHEEGCWKVEDDAVKNLVKHAGDLTVAVLTADEAMEFLYNNGVGEVYMTMLKWMNSKNYQLLATSLLAIGNFARRDDYCAQMMENKMYDKILDIFEVYHGFSVRMQTHPEEVHPIDKTTVNKILHAALSAIRNLSVPLVNKRIAAAQSRAAPLLIRALPFVEDHQVAYRLLAALRMMVDGQEGVARSVASSGEALRAAARWGAAEHAGAAGEAPRLLAWTARLLPRDPALGLLVQAEGCVSTLVNMVVSSHSVMQNESILALTLISIQTLESTEESQEIQANFVDQLIKAEIGKHVSVLIETNSGKMPQEVAENLIAFLDITSKNDALVSDYREAKVHEALKKFVDLRQNFSDELKMCIHNVIALIHGDEIN